MSKKIIKRTISLALIVVMMISTISISVVSTSAESKITYKFNIQTAGRLGTTISKLYFKVNGTDGSTDWHSVDHVGGFRNKSNSFSDIDVGTIESISVKKNLKIDDWYPEYITVTKSNSNNSTTVYGGRWVEGKNEYKLSTTDNVYKIDINTSTEKGAGTNWDVYTTLVDKNNVNSSEINVTSIHPAIDAFEAGDKVTFYINVPSNFSELKDVKFRLNNGDGGAYIIISGLFSFGISPMIDDAQSDWIVDSVSIKKVSGSNVDRYKSFIFKNPNTSKT